MGKPAHAVNLDNFDMGRALLDAAAVQSATNRAHVAGQEYADLRHRTIMRAIAKAYEDALHDPQTRIPTCLQVMLDSIRATVKTYTAVP